MIQASAYAWMNYTMVAVSCVHGKGAGGRHTLWEGAVESECGDLVTVLRDLALAVERATHGVETGCAYESADCPLS